VRSFRTKDFRKLYDQLPKATREQAHEAFRKWQTNPNHPGLEFKSVHPRLPIYSARVSRDYRAVCIRDGDAFVWFWIGPHHAYDKLLRGLS